jgi:hypothetical protein
MYFHSRWRAAIFCSFALAIPFAPHSTGQIVSGRVLAKNGDPLAGVEVYGTRKNCCPTTVVWTITRADGTFRLLKPGAVLHFRRDDLAPISLRVRRASPTKVVMRGQEASIRDIPLCRETVESRFGWHFRFAPPNTGELLKSRDVDYERYGLKGQDGGTLDSWFGMTASSVDAETSLYVHSATFSEWFVRAPRMGVIGIDTNGVDKNGSHWRWLGIQPNPKANSNYRLTHKTLDRHWRLMIATDQIGYTNASERDQKKFDEIINSACVTPE